MISQDPVEHACNVAHSKHVFIGIWIYLMTLFNDFI